MTWSILVLFLVPFAYGALVCDQPVGIEDGRIPDQNLKASSRYSRFQSAKEGRLNNYKGKTGGEGAWCAIKDHPDPYLEVDLGSVRKIGYILTQGRNTTYPQYVKEFKVYYSTRGTIFVPIKDPATGLPMLYSGNSDSNSIVKTDLRLDPSYPLNARYIRVFPTQYYSNPCIRIELLECSLISEPTTPVPTTPAPTTAKPECPAGYKFASDNVTCVDIDECSDGSSRCDKSSTECVNNDGGYSCKCKAGFKINQWNNFSCLDIDECTETNHTCSQICNNNDGGYSCSCKRGYSLNDDGRTCSDIDECTTSNPNEKARCDSTSTSCSNYIGGYKCVCLSGYRRQDRFTCLDKNECYNGEALCSLQSTQCVNLPGRYECMCKKGYKRTAAEAVTMPYSCPDIDECSINNGNCSNGCQNLNGTYICTCPTGYEIKAPDRFTCQDKNECEHADGGCEQLCRNTVGSYYCKCLDGFKLVEKYKCQDIDECSEGKSKCDLNSTNCHNTHPYYQCNCKAGYKAIANDRYRCEPLRCRALTQHSGTIVSPSSCLQSGVPKVNDVCTYTCEPGYKIPSGAISSTTCQPNGAWTGSMAACVRKTCPKLSPPANGKIKPDSCQTSGNYYKENCYYHCDYNYRPVGDDSRTCQADGTWTTPTTTFSCKLNVPKPTITCPSPVIVKLQTGASTADLSALLGDPKSNVKDITISPSKYQTTKVFPAGDIILTYTARNSINETDSCRTYVTVQDVEPPKVVYCPPNIHELVNPGPTKQVTWTVPKFSDNVGVVKVTSTHNPGDTFKIGPVVVYYTATDAAGNRVSCDFDVIIRKAECPAPPKPDGGTITVHEFNGIKFASVKCNPGKHLFISTWGIYCKKDTLKWDPVPDCVDSVAMPSSGICGEGFVKQQGMGSQNVCVKCPRGYAYDTVKKICSKCPKGQYSGSEGSLSCTPCPSNQGTLTDGAKVCIDKCTPGRESADGFTYVDVPCKFCRKGFYEDRYGSTACKSCPSGLSTLSTGSLRLSDCGVRPSITEFVAQPNNVTERNRVDFICKGSGVPEPFIAIKKIKPASEGYGGPVQQSNILDASGKKIGLRYTITKTTEYDAGSYKCELHNKFGKSTNYAALHVELIYGPIPDRRRR